MQPLLILAALMISPWPSAAQSPDPLDGIGHTSFEVFYTNGENDLPAPPSEMEMFEFPPRFTKFESKASLPEMFGIWEGNVISTTLRGVDKEYGMVSEFTLPKK